MDVELKKKWVDALRSDKYSQTQGQLRNDKGYCCLGVLCDLLKESEDDWIYRNDAGYTFKGSYTCYPPQEIIDMYSFSGVSTGKLASLNDDKYSFEDIANFIEENVRTG